VEKSLENYPYKDIACELKKGLTFSCGNWSCSTQDLSETRSLQNNEPARQKGVHDYVVNTLNLFSKGI
jgi:hypothetical protein